MHGAKLSQGQRLLLLFTLTVIAPGILLAALGARALRQERDQADQQLKIRVDRGAQEAGRELVRQLEQLQGLADRGTASLDAFQGWPEDASWAFIERTSNSLHIVPSGAMPYDLAPRQAISPGPDALADAVRWEAELAPEALIAKYRAQLVDADLSLRPAWKHRLTRALRRNGQSHEALNLLQHVQAEGGRIGALSAELVAEYEIATLQPETAPAFYQRLASGRWRMEKPLYLYYSSVMRQTLPPNAVEEQKFELARAVEAALSDQHEQSAPWTVFRSDSGSSLLLVSKAFMANRIWPAVARVLESELALIRITREDTTFYEVHSGEDGSYAIVPGGWTVHVAPRNAAKLRADSQFRFKIYVAMLVVILALLVSGGYLVTRTVRRELEVARMKADFVATVSHEFRSPLTGIRQLSEMLVRGRIVDPAKQGQYHESILAESKRLARLVENVLDFARMEDGRKQYRFEPLDTASWLGMVAEEFQAEAECAGYRLQSSIEPSLPPIAADRDALTTAVRNLLENAMKYSPDSKVIWLYAQASDGGVLIRVRDQGVGIPAGEQARVFEKFYRGEGELAQKVKGVGLGLSLVKHIVDAHRGRIILDSREGVGTTFSIHLEAR